MNYKFIIAIIASILTIIAYIPYLKDIFARKTHPHLFTWFIWMLTQGTAAVALLHGGGKFGSFSLITGTMLVMFIFLLSFEYGTKDVSKNDKIILALALFAIMIWRQLDSPLLAILMVSIIDGAGYIPTIRKSFNDPWGETLSFWAMMAVVDCLAIIANAKYNLLTLTYLSVIFLLNIFVYSVCVYRRRVIEPPKV